MLVVIAVVVIGIDIIVVLCIHLSILKVPGASHSSIEEPACSD